ncbi:hypothetical protein Pfo_016371 [Paulownia fortunei]|nr:hypothetical protein Pfo_016371 [Paulownia fortunei]
MMLNVTRFISSKFIFRMNKAEKRKVCLLRNIDYASHLYYIFLLVLFIGMKHLHCCWVELFEFYFFKIYIHNSSPAFLGCNLIER